MSLSFVLSSVSSSNLLQLQYGEEDTYIQSYFINSNKQEEVEVIMMEQLIQNEQFIPWNVRFRYCMWILRQQQQQQQQIVGKKRKRNNYNNCQKIMKQLLEGIYFDLRISCNQSFQKKKEQLWNHDSMLQTWLVPTNNNNNNNTTTTTSDEIYKLLHIQTKLHYKIGMARYSCTSDLIQLFPSSYNNNNNDVITHHNFPLKKQQKEMIIITEQQPFIQHTTQNNQDKKNQPNDDNHGTILETLKQIIETLDNFVMTFYYQQQQQQQQQQKRHCQFFSQEQHLLLYDENPIYNQSEIVSPFTQYNPRLFADKKKRRKDKQRDCNNISLFQMHSQDISKKYTGSFEERKQIEEQMNKAIKDGRGRYYMEYLLFDLIHSKNIIDMTNDDDQKKRKEHNETKHDNLTLIRGRALLTANLRELLGYTHRDKLKTFLGESSNSTKKNKSSSTLQPSPLPSFFGMTKQEFSSSIFWQKKTTATNISSNNTNDKKERDDHATTLTNITTNERPYPQAQNWKLEEENFDEPQPQTLSSTQMTNGDKDFNEKIRVISSISEVGLEVCLENFLKGTNKNERVKPLSLSNIFDGFTSFDQNLINDHKKDYQIPDVTDLLHDLFDLLVHKSIISSQSSALDEIDAVAEKNSATTFAQEDVDTILQMAKQFGMWLPLNPLVEKFRICLRILLLSRDDHHSQVGTERLGCDNDKKQDKWTSDIAEILRELSLSSKVSLLLNLVKFYGAVFQSTHFYGHDITEKVQNNYFSNLCFSWYFLLDKRFCDIDILELGWESDLAAYSFFSSISPEEQYLVTMKSTTSSKLILCTLMEGILDSIKRCYDIMKVVKKVSSNDTSNGLKNLVWCVHSMTDFFPYCLDTSFGIESFENKPFCDKVIIVNDKLRKICHQIWTNLSLFDKGTNEPMKSDDSMGLDLFESYIHQTRGALSFEMYILQLISFALNSKWKDQQPTSWCKYVVYNIIAENYLLTNPQQDCKNDRNITIINPCCMLKIWIEQVFIALMKKQSQIDTVETKQNFHMTPLLKGIHQCIVKMIVLRGGDTIDLKANRLIPLESVDHVSRMLIRLQHVGKRRFSPYARLSSWNEIFCNTDARYLFCLIQSCCHDENDETFSGSAESIIEKCLYLSNNALPVLMNLFFGVGLFVDNELKRLKNGPEKDKKLFFHHIQYYRTEFHHSSHIISYIKKMKSTAWQNDSTWLLLTKRVYFQLKSNGASLGLVWWKNLTEEIDAEPTMTIAKEEGGKSALFDDTNFDISDDNDGWDNLSNNSEKIYLRNGMSVDNLNHQFWSDHKIYPRSKNVKSESRIDDDIFQKE